MTAVVEICPDTAAEHVFAAVATSTPTRARASGAPALHLTLVGSRSLPVPTAGATTATDARLSLGTPDEGTPDEGPADEGPAGLVHGGPASRPRVRLVLAGSERAFISVTS